jgi:hypothetical protein
MKNLKIILYYSLMLNNIRSMIPVSEEEYDEVFSSDIDFKESPEKNISSIIRDRDAIEKKIKLKKLANEGKKYQNERRKESLPKRVLVNLPYEDEGENESESDYNDSEKDSYEQENQSDNESDSSSLKEMDSEEMYVFCLEEYKKNLRKATSGTLGLKHKTEPNRRKRLKREPEIDKEPQFSEMHMNEEKIEEVEAIEQDQIEEVEIVANKNNIMEEVEYPPFPLMEDYAPDNNTMELPPITFGAFQKQYKGIPFEIYRIVNGARNNPPTIEVFFNHIQEKKEEIIPEPVHINDKSIQLCNKYIMEQEYKIEIIKVSAVNYNRTPDERINQFKLKSYYNDSRKNTFNEGINNILHVDKRIIKDDLKIDFLSYLVHLVYNPEINLKEINIKSVDMDSIRIESIVDLKNLETFSIDKGVGEVALVTNVGGRKNLSLMTLLLNALFSRDKGIKIIIDAFPNINRLKVTGNTSYLENINLSAHVNLIHIDLSGNALSSIDLTNNHWLESLNISNNLFNHTNNILLNLKNPTRPLCVDVSNNKINLNSHQDYIHPNSIFSFNNINNLKLRNNLIKSININSLIYITQLNLCNNRLEFLDLSCLLELRTVNLSWNRITDISLSKDQTRLTTVELIHNKLTRKIFNQISKLYGTIQHLDMRENKNIQCEVEIYHQARKNRWTYLGFNNFSFRRSNVHNSSRENEFMPLVEVYQSEKSFEASGERVLKLRNERFRYKHTMGPIR